MDPNDIDRKDSDVSDTGIDTERKQADIHVEGNLVCAVSSAGPLAVAAVTSPVTAHSVTGMKIIAANVPIGQAKSNNLKIKATSISGMLFTLIKLTVNVQEQYT